MVPERRADRVADVLIVSEHLGPIEVDDAHVIEVPGGIMGFPEAQRYAIVSAEDTGIYSWLQSLDHPDLAFLVVVPAAFFPDYEPDLPDDDCAAIGLTRPEDAQLLCIVTIDDEDVTANLLGPVVVNVATRRARQVVLTHGDWPTRASIRPAVGD
jgi:flagellar assembly factor FliW